MDNIEKSFCVIPWVQLSSKPIGTARVCCLMTNSDDPDQGTISDDAGQPYNLGRDDFDVIKNGAKAREIRLAMLNGQRPNDCKTCWIKEDMGASSKRTVSNNMYKDEFTVETARQCTDSQGYTTWEPSYWDLRFGNLCNLKCVMCHPASSNQWYKDFVLINNRTTFTDSGIKVKLQYDNNRYHDSGEYNWWDNDDFWTRLEAKIPYLKQVYLVGGEPMLIEPHYDFLQKIIDYGRAGQVTLEYDTNLTAIHPRALAMWKNFKKIWLRVSIDDYGDQFNYIRFPANWSQVSKNLEYLNQQKDINVKLDVTVTWQLLSAFTTPNLIKYLDQFPKIQTSIRILSSPNYYDVKVLDRLSKLQLIDLYQKIEKQCPRIKVNHLIKYLENNLDGDQKLLEQAINTVSRLDTIRNTNWETTFETLKESINGK